MERRWGTMTWQQPPPGYPSPQGYPPAYGAPPQPPQPPPKKPTSAIEVLGLVLALFGVLGLCGFCALAGVRKPSEAGGSTGATATVPRAPPAGKPPTYKRLGTFAKNGSGELWDNVQVSPRITRDELITLAKHLHYQDPARPVRFLTDGSQYEKYRLYDIHYGTPQGASHPYPKAWVEQHYIARMSCMMVSGGCEWRLSRAFSERFGPDETIAYLE